MCRTISNRRRLRQREKASTKYIGEGDGVEKLDGGLRLDGDLDCRIQYANDSSADNPIRHLILHKDNDLLLSQEFSILSAADIKAARA